MIDDERNDKHSGRDRMRQKETNANPILVLYKRARLFITRPPSLLPFYYSFVVTHPEKKKHFFPLSFLIQSGKKERHLVVVAWDGTSVLRHRDPPGAAKQQWRLFF